MTTFSAVILAGGMSRRFGSPKASALFLGEPMLAWVLGAASSVADEIVVVGAPGHQLPEVKTRARLVRIDDIVAHEGPLAGLRTGLLASSGEWVFALGCDMPLLTGELLSALAGLRGGNDAVVPHVDGRSQPLAALYQREAALRAFDDAWSGGVRSLHGAMAELRVVEPGPGDLGTGDAARIAFSPVNTPEELAAIEVLARQQRAGTLGLPKPGSGGGSIGS